MDPVANPFRSVNDVPTRARALDAMRGAAVLAMIAWHVADAWLAPSFRSGPAWHAVRVVGGLAAPLFLYAAGANVARAIAAGATIGDVARRGGEVFALGILLRAQIWAVDAGGLSEPRAWPAIVALGGGAALTVGAARASRHDADGIASRWLRDVPWIVGPLLIVIGAAIVIVDHPERCSLALRFDALHCVGASIAIAAALSRTPSYVRASITIALLVLGATTTTTTIDSSEYTAWLARSTDHASLSSFPLAPYAAYAILGSSHHVTLSRYPGRSLAIGTIVATLTFGGGLDEVRRTIATFPAARPWAHFAFTIASTLALAGASQLFLRAIDSCLTRLGRRSLSVYWIHVTVVFGFVTAPLHRALAPLPCALSVVVFALAGGAAIGAGRALSRAQTSSRGSFHHRTRVHDSGFGQGRS